MLFTPSGPQTLTHSCSELLLKYHLDDRLSFKLILEKDEIIKQLLSGKFIFWFRVTSVFQILLFRIQKDAIAFVRYRYCKWLTNGDKVAQLVWCRTSNWSVAGSIPSWGTLVCPWARQFIPYCFSLPSCKIGT